MQELDLHFDFDLKEYDQMFKEIELEIEQFNKKYDFDSILKELEPNLDFYLKDLDF